MKRCVKWILLCTNISFSMQLTVKEEDIHTRPRKFTETAILKMTEDFCPITYIKMSEIEINVLKNIEDLRNSPSIRVKDLMTKLRQTARNYMNNEEEATRELFDDTEMIYYINSIVVKSMDEYLHEKDIALEELEKRSRKDRIQKYLAFTASGCLTLISIVVPIIVTVIQCE